MEPLKIATVQFETRDNDKVYNPVSYTHLTLPTIA